MGRPSTRRALVAFLVLGTGALAACTPEPPAGSSPPPASSPSPVPPPPALPAAPGGAATGPLIGEPSPDPFVLSVDPQFCATPDVPTACYFAYTTGFWLFLAPVWRSTDLVHWTQVIDDVVRGSALAEIAPWSKFEDHWAPAVLERPDNPPWSRFVLWYTGHDRQSDRQCLGVAFSAWPAGPFYDRASSPAYCQHNLGGTIDPEPFVDTDGTPYLLYKSEGVAGSVRAAIWASRLSPDGSTVVPGTEHMLLEVEPTGWEDSVVEAPSMVRVDGVLHLFYSASHWSSADYKVGAARCDTVLGPCRRVYSTPVLATRGAMLGPGGASAFRDHDGQWRVAFHAWSPVVGSGGERRLRILPLTFPGGNPAIG